MSFFTKFFGAASAQPIEAVGNVLDKLFTSDDERLDKKTILAKLALEPQIAQTEINKIEAQHRSIFVAGWRPAVGWVCAFGLANVFLLNPWVQWVAGEAGPTLPKEIMLELVIALLGLGALRTAEKFGGRTK